jgi:hypothetical protein
MTNLIHRVRYQVDHLVVVVDLVERWNKQESNANVLYNQ